MPSVSHSNAVWFHRLLPSLVVGCLLATTGHGVGWAHNADTVTLRFGGPHVAHDGPGNLVVSCDEVSHHAFDTMLRNYVDDKGMVCYSTWHKTPHDVHRLGSYLLSLARVDPRLPSSQEAVMAYAINAYNALTLWGILHEYPVSSIQQIDGKHSSFAIFDDLQIWSGDGYVSLNAIENDVLRPMGDLRIHFALVCAAKGCPRLRNRAYTAEHLYRQLDDNAREFFADSSRFRISHFSSTVHLSPILKWYREDFGQTDCEIVTAVFPYLPPDDRAWLSVHSDWTMKYLGYDWALNDQCPTMSVALAACPYKAWSRVSPTVESMKRMRLPMHGESDDQPCESPSPADASAGIERSP